MLKMIIATSSDQHLRSGIHTSNCDMTSSTSCVSILKKLDNANSILPTMHDWNNITCYTGPIINKSKDKPSSINAV